MKTSPQRLLSWTDEPSLIAIYIHFYNLVQLSSFSAFFFPFPHPLHFGQLHPHLHSYRRSGCCTRYPRIMFDVLQYLFLFHVLAYAHHCWSLFCWVTGQV